MIEVEYLVVVKKADAFCEDVAAFNQLLDVDSRLKVSKKKIKCDGDEYAYTASVGDVSNKDQRYFSVTISLDADPTDENVEAFASMLSIVRSAIRRLSDTLEILKDDISTYYSELAYGKIHRIENLMRRLITNFMVVTVGANWIDESTPKPVKEALDSSKRKGWTANVLDEVDFIVLSQYLLHEYCQGPLDKILRELPEVTTTDELEKFKERFALKSNWTRYFSDIVDCEEEFLKKRWGRLYELRCKVAHNALINKADFDEIERLISELETPLSTAIAKIGEVEVPEDEVENVVSEADATSAEAVLRDLRHVSGVSATAGYLKQMERAMRKSPTVQRERAIRKSPTVQMERAIRKSPTVQMERAMRNSPVVLMERVMRNSPAALMERAMRNSPAAQLESAMENSPAAQLERAMRNSPAAQLENSDPVLDEPGEPQE